MRLAFLNPQGNFDKNDSYLTEHPDFGGQLVYVKEICKALVKLGVKVDIITRKIVDPDWHGFSSDIDYYGDSGEDLRIVRIAFGGDRFLNKEKLWHYLNEYADNIIKFYNGDLPDFVTSHYGDGGYSAVLLKHKAGMHYSFTAHSLGAQKLDKLGTNEANFKEMDEKYQFSKRIMAERLTMKYADKIFTSTKQERFKQYSHELYSGTVDVDNDNKFCVSPPGINTVIFNRTINDMDRAFHNRIKQESKPQDKPHIVLSSRLDEKKNHIGVVKAYAESEELQKISNLAIFLRGIDNPYVDVDNLPDKEKGILTDLLIHIKDKHLENNVCFLNLKSQKELASAYKYFAGLNSVFALSAYHEPFGLAPIEAAACGLAVVATQNGGPSEIFEDGSGILIDPYNTNVITTGLIRGIRNAKHYAKIGEQRVISKYTWDKTAEKYLEAIEDAIRNKDRSPELETIPPTLDASGRILDYLKSKQ